MGGRYSRSWWVVLSLSSRVSILLEVSSLEALRGRQEKVVLRGLKHMFLLSHRKYFLPGTCLLCTNIVLAHVDQLLLFY